MTMTTLEAIQFLLDNPDEMIREVDPVSLPYSYARNCNGTIMSCDEKGNDLCIFSLAKSKFDVQWEVVKKPPKQVSWQEAIQAWIDGKNFKIVLPYGEELTQYTVFKLGTRLNKESDKRGFDVSCFAEGKWYILD